MTSVRPTPIPPDEAKLSPGDLWDKKFAESGDSAKATNYVAQFYGPPKIQADATAVNPRPNGGGILSNLGRGVLGAVTAPINSFFDAVAAPGVGEARPDPRLSKGGNSAGVPLNQPAYDAEHGAVTSTQRTQAGLQTAANVAAPSIARIPYAGIPLAGAGVGASYDPEHPVQGAAIGAGTALALHGGGKLLGKTGSALLDATGARPESYAGVPRLGTVARDFTNKLLSPLTNDASVGLGEPHQGPVMPDAFGSEVPTLSTRRVTGPNPTPQPGTLLKSTARALGVQSQEDRASQMLSNAARASGITPQAAGAVPVQSPSTVLDLAEPGSPIHRLARQAWNVPTSTAQPTMRSFYADRSAGTGDRIQSALSDATGAVATDTDLPVEARIAQRAEEAKPLYKQAYAYGEIQDPQTVAQIQSLLKNPTFAKAWKRGKALMDLEAPDTAPEVSQSASEPPALPIRDQAGRLRRDLSSVSTNDLETEWRRLAELNADEEGQFGAVGDAHYRSNYEDLPRTEKLGHKGKEDLPDADGEVDPETLLRDNKTVSGYNKNQIIRAARQKSLDRINAELSSRPVSDPNSFAFGENATPGPQVSPDNMAWLKEQGLDKYIPQARQAAPTVRQIDYWKKGLDAQIESGAGSENALSRTEARAYRKKLSGVLSRVDAEVPAYAEARQNFAGHSNLLEASEAGAEHFSPGTSASYLQRTLPERFPTAGEQSEYNTNAINSFVQKVRNLAANPDLPQAARGTNLVQRLMGTADAGAKLRMLFPDDASYAGFIQQMEQEARYPKTQGFFANQSSTAGQLAENKMDPGLWKDVITSPFSSGARMKLAMRALNAESKMRPEIANQIGTQAIQTGPDMQRLVNNRFVKAAKRGTAGSLVRSGVANSAARNDPFQF